MKMLPAMILLACLPLCLVAEDATKAEDATSVGPEKTVETTKPADAAPSANMIPLNKAGTVLVDKKNKTLHVKTMVVLTKGSLEMLCCLKQTKEHESILMFDGKAFTLHAGMLAVGLKPGKPVSFSPFQPATGDKVQITLRWKDKQGKEHRKPAQHWMRGATSRYYGEALAMLPEGVEIPIESDLRYHEMIKELSWYGIMSKAERDKWLKASDDAAFQKAIRSFYNRSQIKPMTADFVFAGSSTGKTRSGETFYRAEGGDVICVANFPTAMIDIGQESSSDGEQSLLYEVWTERVPPLETEVWIELSAMPKEASPADKPADETKAVKP